MTLLLMCLLFGIWSSCDSAVEVATLKGRHQVTHITIFLFATIGQCAVHLPIPLLLHHNSHGIDQMLILKIRARENIQMDIYKIQHD